MTESPEKFCLKWNDFQENIIGSFQQLRNDTEFSDVTLVCEEDQQIEAHRVILSACSPFFKTVLNRNKHLHPLIYMRGLRVKNLVAIMDFIYYGEANVFQEDLDSFLALAEELQLKGLTGSQSDTLDEKEETPIKSRLTKPTARTSFKHEPQNIVKVSIDESFDQHEKINTKCQEVSLIVPFDGGVINVAGDVTKEELEAKKMSIIERVEDGVSNWRCTVCGKTTKVGSKLQDIKRHAETHMEGASYPCNQCGKVSRSSHALQSHVTSYHRK